MTISIENSSTWARARLNAARGLHPLLKNKDNFQQGNMESASTSNDSNSNSGHSVEDSSEIEHEFSEQSFSELEDREEGLPKKIKGRGTRDTATMSSESVRRKVWPKKETSQREGRKTDLKSRNVSTPN